MTHRLEILVPGLWPRADQGPDPETPARLAKALGRGHCAPSRVLGWEDAVAIRLGFRHGPAGRSRGLALPVSMTAGMTDAVARAVEDLTPGEASALSQAIAPELEDASAVLREIAPGMFELELDGEGEWDSPPPSCALGQPIRVPRMHNPIARRLQVLGNAVQMAWFGHPVNQERIATGRTPVHGLWFWSPGVPAEAPAARMVAGGGAVARWLTALAGVAWSADPLEPAADLTVVDALSRVERHERRSDLLESLSEDVLQPRIEHLRAGQFSELVVHDPGVAELHLRRGDWRRFWRRPRRLALPQGRF